MLHTFVQHAKAELPDIALWNPHIMAGRPFLANMQSQILSPFSLPAYALPFYESLAITAALKLFLGCLGAFLLARALGMRYAGSLLAGTVFGFDLWLVTWLVYPHASVWALIPWLLWLADRLLSRPDGLSFALLAGAVGVQFLAGHPESSFHALLVTVAFVALRAFQLRRDGRLPALARPLLLFAGSLVAGAALAAVVLLPFLELVLRSADLEQRAGSAVDAKTAPRFLLGFFLYDYWGRSTGTPLELFLLARAFYVGALPLMLGAAALILRPRLERVAVAGFAALCMAVVVGVPPIFQIVTALPVFSSGHNTRLALLALLCIALLAGWGLDELIERRDPWERRRRLVAWSSVAIFALPLVWVALARTVSFGDLGEALEVAWLLGTPPGNLDAGAADVIRLASALVWVLFGAAALALVLLRERGRLPAAAFASLAVLLTVVDLFRAGMGYTPAIDERFADQPATGAVPLPPAQAAVALRGAGGDPAERALDALRPLRGARLRPPGRQALRHAVAPLRESPVRLAGGREPAGDPALVPGGDARAAARAGPARSDGRAAVARRARARRTARRPARLQRPGRARVRLRPGAAAGVRGRRPDRGSLRGGGARGDRRPELRRPPDGDRRGAASTACPRASARRPARPSSPASSRSGSRSP